MGASGDLHIIDLSMHSFEQMKQTMLDKLSELEQGTYQRNSFGDYLDYEQVFYDVCKFKNIDDLIVYFGTEVHYYCPAESGIWINGHFYDEWAEQRMPQIIMGFLVLYETDQQEEHHNLPSVLLREYISKTVEIWT